MNREAEAHWLHRCYFRGPAPADVVRQYADAHSVCSLTDTVAIARAAELDVDAEALEFALRRRGDTLLTRKTQVLFYLLEVRPEYDSFFYNRTPAPVRGKVALITAGLRSAWKLMKGEWILSTRLRRH